MNEMNGNSFGHKEERIGPKSLINKHEFLRVIEQSLYNLGYDAVAKQLEADSVKGTLVYCALNSNN
jgi:hypothetical protein